MRALDELLNVSVPRESQTERAIARSKATTDMTVPWAISTRARRSSVRWQGLTIFPSWGPCEEVLGIEAGSDKDKSEDDSDIVGSYQLPANGLILVRRGMRCWTRHVVCGRAGCEVVVPRVVEGSRGS